MNRALADTPGLPAEVPYRVVGLLGRGATAAVYRAVHEAHGGEAAVKVFRPGIGEDARRRFAAECSLQWRLSDHPNVVRLLHASSLDVPRPWTVLELYDTSLDAVIGSPRRPDSALLRRWGLDLVRGLAAVHAERRLHRDVKPSNVLVRHGVAALSDFGSSLVVGEEADGIAGTPRYLAPELRAGGPATTRSDVFAAGVTLRRLWGDDVPPAVAGVLDRATSYDPADRPVDAGALLAELDGLLTAPVPVAAAPPPVGVPYPAAALPLALHGPPAHPPATWTPADAWPPPTRPRRAPVVGVVAALLALAVPVVAGALWAAAGGGLLSALPGPASDSSGTAARVDGPTPQPSTSSKTTVPTPSTSPATRRPTGRETRERTREAVTPTRPAGAPAATPSPSGTGTPTGSGGPGDAAEDADPPRVELPRLPVEREQDLRGTPSGAATSIEFANEGAAAIRVYFLADSGRMLYGELGPGLLYRQPTYVGHSWVVTDAADQALFVVAAAPEPGRVTVR